MSFGESVFPAGFNQKTAKEDLIIKGKYGVPPRYLRGKTLEGSKRQITEAGHRSLTPGAARPQGPPLVSLLRMSGPHRLKVVF